MNISQAKEINLNDFLSWLGCSPDKTDHEGNTWYCSPFRNEKTASFKVFANGKNWIDFSESPHRSGSNAQAAKFASGTIIDLALHYWQLDPKDIKGALEQIRSKAGNPTTPSQAKRPNNQTAQDTDRSTEPSGLNLLDVYEFSQWTGKGRSRNFSPQAQYLSNRGLNPTLCAPYVHTVKFSGNKTPKKAWYGLGFRNDAGGYEIRAKFGDTNFKGVVGAKDITHIKPKAPSHRLHIFEGYTDFLTALHILPAEIDPKDEHFLILNSAALIARAKAAISANDYSTLILWTQNDPKGKEVEQYFLDLPNELPQLATVGTMAHLYEGEKDLNLWHVANKNTPKIDLEAVQKIVSLQIGTMSYDIFNRPKPF